MGRGQKLSVVLVPFPYQGHTTPMLQLASILQSKGFSIIFAHADIISFDPLNHPGFVFRHLPSNLTTSFHASDIRGLGYVMLELNKNLKAPLEDYMVKLLSDNEGEHGQIVCLIRDFNMYFAESVAANLKLPSLVLRTYMAAAVQPYHYLLQQHAENRLTFPFPESKMQELVPELPPLRFKDLSVLLPNAEIREETREYISLLNGINTSVGIIWNSMDHLEHIPLTELQQFHNVRFFPIGPFHKRAAPASTSFLKEDLSCISWLDKQATNSVLYISLGSIAVIDGEELRETAWGLANSGQPFLWVVRPKSVVDGVQWENFLPYGFREMVGERGQIVKWAPQKQVLAHPAVGGFWSHCGWNSTLESMCEGVPMICTPRFGDQMINARYLTDKWKVGIEIENVKDRGGIEKNIRRLMVDEESKELRERMLKMKAYAWVGFGAAVVGILHEGVPIICRPKVTDQLVNGRYINHVWKVGLELDDVLNNLEKLWQW